jgi:hypothetical protein
MNADCRAPDGGCRRELLNRTPISIRLHLRRILHEYETRHSQHQPLRSLHTTAPDETATRTGPTLSSTAMKTRSRWWHDQRVSPGRATWMRFSAPTGPPGRPCVSSAKAKPHTRPRQTGRGAAGQRSQARYRRSSILTTRITSQSPAPRAALTPRASGRPRPSACTAPGAVATPVLIS